jgi:hypothetical protein
MNLYTIGSPKANRWAGMLMRDFFKNRAPHWEFKPDPESDDITNPRVIIRQDGQKYSPPNAPSVGRTRWDYGLVIRGPHPKDARCMFLIMAGRSALGTAATCLAVTAPECLSLLNQRLNLQGINLNNHKQAFCAVVSICAEDRVMDLSSFAVHDIFAY